MKQRKRDDGFNLAFLDVMACGLGAVLLILIIVKFNEVAPEPPDDVKSLQEQLNALLSENNQLEKQIGMLKGSAARSESQSEKLERELDQQIAQLQKQKEQALQKVKDLNAMAKYDAPPPPAPTAKVEVRGTGEEDYLLGLKMQGKRIGILVDSSGSMVADTLTTALLVKNKADSQRQAMPKWQNTRRVVDWLLARAPNDAQVALVAYNDKPVSIGRPVNTVRVSGSMQRLSGDFKAVAPQNGSDLQSALRHIFSVMPDMTDLYIVTDGLPNLSPSGLSLSGCGL
ncbi:MAG: VWA domain-containing protein, partial [Limnobacter sp.]|nr:VWA domain-containing protein [Limnobacter sp.]